MIFFVNTFFDIRSFSVSSQVEFYTNGDLSNLLALLFEKGLLPVILTSVYCAQENTQGFTLSF